MPGGVHHIAVLVRDLDRAEAFYVGVLGLDVIRRWDDEQGRPRSIWLRLGGDDVPFLAVERMNDDIEQRAPGAPGWHCVALAIPMDERQLWRARLEAAGHPLERETRFTIYARDPEGNLIALSHYPRTSGSQ